MSRTEETLPTQPAGPAQPAAVPTGGPADSTDLARHTDGRTPMHPRVRELTQRPGVEAAFAGDLALATRIDRAHVVMLVERRVLPSRQGAALLGAIDGLRERDFADLRGRPAPRGWYLMYERYLSDQLGPDVGGSLQLGRSRNDLSATLHQLRLRRPFLGLLWEGVRLLGTLVRGARRHERVVMPAFTHHQPAVPVTYGHYLNGVALSLSGSLETLAEVTRDLDRCPLGAGGVGGTSVPIDNARTAELLGFAAPFGNSVTAVASRDAALRLCAAATVIGVLVSRVAGDLLQWTSAERPLLRVPDELTGGSSMMPQKRNVFVLEHAAGKAAAPLGAFATAAAAMHKAPFSNSIAVHTEAVRPVEDAMEQVTRALELLRLVLQFARPDAEAMTARAESGFTSATEAANRLALDAGVGFRAAHTALAGAVRSASETGTGLAEAVARLPEAAGAHRLVVSPEDVAAAAEYGGGPGVESLRGCLAANRRQLGALQGLLRSLRERWYGCTPALDEAVAAIRRGTGTAGPGDTRRTR